MKIRGRKKFACACDMIHTYIQAHGRKTYPTENSLPAFTLGAGSNDIPRLASPPSVSVPPTPPPGAAPPPLIIP